MSSLGGIYSPRHIEMDNVHELSNGSALVMCKDDVHVKRQGNYSAPTFTTERTRIFILFTCDSTVATV